jgi:hypothetical protein
MSVGRELVRWLNWLVERGDLEQPLDENERQHLGGAVDPRNVCAPGSEVGIACSVASADDLKTPPDLPQSSFREREHCDAIALGTEPLATSSPMRLNAVLGTAGDKDHGDSSMLLQPGVVNAGPTVTTTDVERPARLQPARTRTLVPSVMREGANP